MRTTASSEAVLFQRVDSGTKNVSLCGREKCNSWGKWVVKRAWEDLLSGAQGRENMQLSAVTAKFKR